MKYAVIIPAERDDATQIVENLKQQTLPPTDIFVIKDEYIDLNFNLGERIIGIVNKKISEIGRAYDMVAKIDADITLPLNFFEICSEFYNPYVGIIGPNLVYSNGKDCFPKSNKKTYGAVKVYTKNFLNSLNWQLPGMAGWGVIDSMICENMGFTEVILPINAVQHRVTGIAYNNDYHLIVGMTYRNSGMNFKKMCLSVAKALFTKVIRINKIHLVFYGYFK